MTFTSRYT